MLLPTVIIHSYSPDDIRLNLKIISNKFNDATVVIAKSAIIQKNIQQIELPLMTFDDDDDCDLVLSLKLANTFKFNKYLKVVEQIISCRV